MKNERKYDFSDFKIESALPVIYDYILSHKAEVISKIETDLNQKNENQKYAKLVKLITKQKLELNVILNILIMIVGFLLSLTSINVTLLIFSLLIINNSSLMAKKAYTNYSNQKSKQKYKELLDILQELSKENETLTSAQIHSLTQSLQNKKVNSDAKSQTQVLNSTNFTINYDPGLEYGYNVANRVLQLAYPDYEQDIIDIKNTIKNCAQGRANRQVLYNEYYAYISYLKQYEQKCNLYEQMTMQR